MLRQKTLLPVPYFRPATMLTFADSVGFRRYAADNGIAGLAGNAQFPGFGPALDALKCPQALFLAGVASKPPADSTPQRNRPLFASYPLRLLASGFGELANTSMCFPIFCHSCFSGLVSVASSLTWSVLLFCDG